MRKNVRYIALTALVISAFVLSGCDMFRKTNDGKVDLKELMRQLGADGIESVLLEGGAMLNWSALEAGIVNEVYAYVAPKLFGGADAKSPVAGMGVDHPDDAYCLVSQRVQQVGEDILIAGELKNK